MTKTLLIVDDSLAIRKSVLKALKDTNFFDRILQAQNGIEALGVLFSEHIDLIVSDIQMPRLDGYKLLQTVRNLDQYKDLPIIFLTSQSASQQKIKGLQQGANDYLTKPFDPGELVARVKNLLMMKHLKDELAHKNKAMLSANKKLEKLSVTDELTGIWNRRYLWDRLTEEISKAHRYKLKFSCLMIDLDNFKAINDTHGHMTGDTVLAHAAKVLKTQCRLHDLLARFGGEEFVMILHQTDLQGALVMAKRLIQEIGETPFQTEMGSPLHVTISIGVSSYPNKDALDANSLIKKADEALYQAKRLGKNRVEVIQNNRPDQD